MAIALFLEELTYSVDHTYFFVPVLLVVGRLGEKFTEQKENK